MWSKTRLLPPTAVFGALVCAVAILAVLLATPAASQMESNVGLFERTAKKAYQRAPFVSEIRTFLAKRKLFLTILAKRSVAKVAQR